VCSASVGAGSTSSTLPFFVFPNSVLHLPHPGIGIEQINRGRRLCPLAAARGGDRHRRLLRAGGGGGAGGSLAAAQSDEEVRQRWVLLVSEALK